jgi:hypothetical protein
MNGDGCRYSECRMERYCCAIGATAPTSIPPPPSAGCAIARAGRAGLPA